MYAKRTMEQKQYLNRDLEWLKFNERVLEQAINPQTPLLERVRFLNIFHSNLDDFFMKRVGYLKRQHYSSISTLSHDGLTPLKQLQLIREEVLRISSRVVKDLNHELLSQLNAEGIHFLKWSALTKAERTQATHFFQTKIFPILTPMAVDQGHPFPLLSNLSTSIAVSLRLPGSNDLQFVRVKVPSFFPLWIPTREPLISEDKNDYRFYSLVDLILNHLPQLFPKMEVVNHMVFRITRNIDIETDDEGTEDLLELISEELKQRKFADIVRLEHGSRPDPWLLHFLVEELQIPTADIFEFPERIEYKNFDPVLDLNMPNLKYKPWNSLIPTELADEEQSVFSIIKEHDILVHHPYDSFHSSVERFIREAAKDPQVAAIKMTLYRTNEESPIIDLLVQAAESGKHVVCVVELKARLDEARNIHWAQTLEQAGVHVVYGIVGLKTHAKIALVVRMEQNEFRCYNHIATGNYNSKTAQLYTDIGLLTASEDITADSVEFFHYLTGRSLKNDYRKLLVAPVNLKARMLELIHQEITNSKNGLPAQIIAKINNLEDTEIIDSLYLASQSGVKIDLIVRGFSCLRPGVPGLSENIRVRSIIGRFLEHSRVFYFRHGGVSELDGHFYIGSADWMSRNLGGRVEVVVPLETTKHRQEIWDFLQIMLEDSTAWIMEANGHYQRLKNAEGLGCQEKLMEKTKVAARFKPYKQQVDLQ